MRTAGQESTRSSGIESVALHVLAGGRSSCQVSRTQASSSSWHETGWASVSVTARSSGHSAACRADRDARARADRGQSTRDSTKRRRTSAARSMRFRASLTDRSCGCWQGRTRLMLLQGGEDGQRKSGRSSTHRASSKMGDSCGHGGDRMAGHFNSTGIGHDAATT